MEIKIALAGNPNTGKTTLFNALTGSNQYVGNWPGVTVEKKEGKLKGHKDIIVTDLPGIYSLSPYTLEELVARNYLLNDKPDAILNIIDGTNLERNLYLTTQLVELGIPVVIAVNMSDVLERNNETLDLSGLEKAIGCPAISISALKGTGINEAADKVVELAKANKKVNLKHTFGEDIEAALSDISELALGSIDNSQKRWYAIKIFERDSKVLETLSLPSEKSAQIDAIIKSVEDSQDDDADSIITTARYLYISSIIASCYVGVKNYEEYKTKKSSKLSISDKIDRIVTNRILALPIFAIVMFCVYYISISTIGTAATDWVNGPLFEETLVPGATSFLESIGTAPWLVGLIADGIIAGVGAVLGFLPQMLVLFACLAFLEGCGYMARVAFIMDRIFRKFGLSGKSFIPILIGTGCGVPGVMASRTIENEKDRRMTIMTTTFIPCSAKLPIIALIAGALFDNAWWVAPSAYFVGIIAILFSGIVLKKTFMFAGDPAPFVIELPAYHLPTLKSVLSSMFERGWSFVKRAGSVILLSTVAIWFLASFGIVDGAFTMVEDLNDGFLSYIGRSFAWVFTPLGFGEWKAAVATIQGLVAKENVVATFGVLYGFAEVAEDGVEIWGNLQSSFTVAAAYSFLVFNLLCAPCFAAIGAIKREMNSAKWTWFALAYQTGFAYIVALCFYQFMNLFAGGGFGIGTIVAIIAVIFFIYLLVRPNKNEHVSSVSSVKANA